MNRAENALRAWAHRKGIARRVNCGSGDCLVETRIPWPWLAVWASRFRFEQGDITVETEAARGLRRKHRVRCAPRRGYLR